VALAKIAKDAWLRPEDLWTSMPTKVRLQKSSSAASAATRQIGSEVCHPLGVLRLRGLPGATRYSCFSADRDFRGVRRLGPERTACLLLPRQ
jgi:hypothetical protein